MGFFFEGYSLVALAGLVLLVAALVALNELTRRSKALAIAVYCVFPMILVVLIAAGIVGSPSSKTWFGVIKTYSALIGVVGFMLIRYTKLGNRKFAWYFPVAILGVNILEAIYRDYEVFATFKTMTTDAAGLTESLRVDGIQTASGHFDFDVSENQLAWAGVGQGQDTMCPISMLQYMGAIANGGKAAVPRLIEKSTTDYGLPTGIYRTKNSAQLIDEKTAGTIADLMHNNVIETYGQDRFPGMDICAKSGTAEVGADKTPNAWFTGFLRDEDTPYAFIVLVENGGGGARVAGTVASAVLQAAVGR